MLALNLIKLNRGKTMGQELVELNDEIGSAKAGYESSRIKHKTLAGWLTEAYQACGGVYVARHSVTKSRIFPADMNRHQCSKTR